MITLVLSFALCAAWSFTCGALFMRERTKRLERAAERQSAAEAFAAAADPFLLPRRGWSAGSPVPLPGTAAFAIAAALNGRGVLGRSKPDEPVFVLCARDRVAAHAVRAWADLAQHLGANAEKVYGARRLAERMVGWREQHGGGKIPD